MIYILWVIWVSLYACDALMKAEAYIKIDIRSSLHIVKALFRAWCSLPHHQLHLISSQTGTLRVKGSYLHWLSLCLVLVLAQQKPHPYNKCEVLSVCVCLCVHWWECVGVCGGGEGVKYLPSGYDNVTQGRQCTPKQLQTCQDRKDLTQRNKSRFVFLASHW